jgi:hypothetical protein
MAAGQSPRGDGPGQDALGVTLPSTHRPVGLMLEYYSLNLGEGITAESRRQLRPNGGLVVHGGLGLGG